MNKNTIARKTRQRGVTLVVVLLFLLALTSVVLFSARSSLMGEALARNQLDEQIARQAAEAALRDAEIDLLVLNGLGVKVSSPVCVRNGANARFNNTCQGGLCDYGSQKSHAVQDYGSASSSNQSVADAWWPTSKGGRWNDGTKPSSSAKGDCGTFTGGVPLGTFTGASPVAGVARQPEYLVEQIRKQNSFLYRVTARGFGVRSNTEVVVQSYVLAPDASQL